MVTCSKIIGKVLSLQDTDPSSKTYGIWPWLLEEPLEQMSPPDWVERAKQPRCRDATWTMPLGDV